MIKAVSYTHLDENNFSNDNSYEQNNSQAVPGGSVAAHTDNNNGQAAGKATGNYSGVNPGSGQSGPGAVSYTHLKVP